MRLAPPWRRKGRGGLIALLLYSLMGVGLAIGVGLLLSVTIDPRTGAMATAEVFDGESKWTATAYTRPGAAYIESTRNTGGSWSPWQATGAPNTSGPGDAASAWATQAQDGPNEWIELTYAVAVVPKAVHIVENYAPGAVVRVTAFKADGTEVEAWRGKDPTATSVPSGTSKIPLAIDFRTTRLKVYLDSVAVPNWNEIDAVGLVDSADQVQWAVRAKASSFYGGGSSDPQALAVRGLLPRWSGLADPGPAFTSGVVPQEARAVVAYGWPMPVIFGGHDLLAAGYGQITASTVWPSSALTMQSGSYGGSTTVTSGTVSLSPAGPGVMFPPAIPLSGTVAPPAPRRLLWIGMLVNGSLYGVALLLLRFAIRWPTRFFAEVSRMRRGCCIGCGYDLGYDFVQGCPECGWRRHQQRTVSVAANRIDPAPTSAASTHAASIQP